MRPMPGIVATGVRLATLEGLRRVLLRRGPVVAVILLSGSVLAARGLSLEAVGPALPDVGSFRVGSELGERRAGFSGRPKVLIFTSLQDPDWPSIRACILDPVLEVEMASFTGVLVDELLEPEPEANFRSRGIQVVVRGLNGGVLGLVLRGFGCFDLINVLQVARSQFGVPEKSPIYVQLMQDPSYIASEIAMYGCGRAAEWVSFLEEFEGREDEAARTARGILRDHCETFVRGDSNADGRIDISDPVHVLGYMFLGEPASVCLDSADANDDGAVDISDATSLLRYLFLSALESPPLPWPVEGVDPTPDPLDCIWTMP